MTLGRNMNRPLTLLCLMIAGCRSVPEPYALPDTPRSYFEALPAVSPALSPYSDGELSLWFMIGYREGWQRGVSGVNAHMTPWYPQHQQCLRDSRCSNAHREGFDAGFCEGRREADRRLQRSFEDFEQKLNKTEPNKAMEPTPVNVTFPACAGTAPFTSVAHLGR